MKIITCAPGQTHVRDGPNMVAESTASNTELSELVGAHRVLGGELSEFLSAFSVSAKANSLSFLQNSPSLAHNFPLSLVPNGALKNNVPLIS